MRIDPFAMPFTATRLLAATFPPPKWVVPGIIPEGCTLLVGAPKVGKSALLLDIAWSVASGTDVLGLPVEQGSVYYLALEDRARRLKQRSEELVRGRTVNSDALMLRTQAPRMPDLAEELESWCENVDRPRLIIVDVLQRVRRENGGSNVYQEDYHTITGLKTVADDHDVALIVVHHTRKLHGDDRLDLISGSNGLAGAADTVALIERARAEREGTLLVTGRDVEERQYALRYEGLRWSMLDKPASHAGMSDTRQQLAEAVAERPGLTPKQLAEVTGLDYDNVRRTLRRMVDAEQVDSDTEGHYLPVTPVTQSQASDSSDTSDRGSEESTSLAPRLDLANLPSPAPLPESTPF